MKLIVTGVPCLKAAPAHPLASDLYCEHYWVPVVGPTAYLVARRLEPELRR